jgi:hypothetical protein
MKKLLGAALIAGSLTCAGCFTTTPHEAARTGPSTPLTAAKTPPPPVTPEQVNAANGHLIAQKLEAEMDRDTKEP